MAKLNIERVKWNILILRKLCVVYYREHKLTCCKIQLEVIRTVMGTNKYILSHFLREMLTCLNLN
jgi:hypothetical protein